MLIVTLFIRPFICPFRFFRFVFPFVNVLPSRRDQRKSR